MLIMLRRLASSCGTPCFSDFTSESINCLRIYRTSGVTTVISSSGVPTEGAQEEIPLDILHRPIICGAERPELCVCGEKIEQGCPSAGPGLQGLVIALQCMMSWTHRGCLYRPGFRQKLSHNYGTLSENLAVSRLNTNP